MWKGCESVNWISTVYSSSIIALNIQELFRPEGWKKIFNTNNPSPPLQRLQHIHRLHSKPHSFGHWRVVWRLVSAWGYRRFFFRNRSTTFHVWAQGVDMHLRDSSDNMCEGASCSRLASRFAPSGPRPCPPLRFILLTTLAIVPPISTVIFPREFTCRAARDAGA